LALSTRTSVGCIDGQRDDRMDLPHCQGEDCWMKVKVKLSNLLRQFSQLQGEPEVFEVTGSNPLECLRVMVERYPSMRKWVYDKDGRLLGLMQFFVNGEKLLLSEYSKTLKDGDELYIFFATGGG
jgi:molybdopterin converting factor small subunit